MMVLWCLIENVVFKFGFEKGVSLTKFHFYIKRSMEISGKGLLHFHRESSNRTMARLNSSVMVLDHLDNR